MISISLYKGITMDKLPDVDINHQSPTVMPVTLQPHGESTLTGMYAIKPKNCPSVNKSNILFIASLCGCRNYTDGSKLIL